VAHACFVEIDSADFGFADLRWRGELFQGLIADENIG